jgi:hypothetical protein
MRVPFGQLIHSKHLRQHVHGQPVEYNSTRNHEARFARMEWERNDSALTFMTLRANSPNGISRYMVAVRRLEVKPI